MMDSGTGVGEGHIDVFVGEMFLSDVRDLGAFYSKVRIVR